MRPPNFLSLMSTVDWRAELLANLPCKFASGTRRAGFDIGERIKLDPPPIGASLAIAANSLITAWLEVRVLPGPPRILVLTEISRNPAIRPEIGGVA